MRCIFFGTPEFSVPALEQLNKHEEVCLVVTQEDKRRGRGKKLKPSPVKEKALNLGIEVFQPENINNPDSLKKLRSYEADLFVVVAYGQILKAELLSIPKIDIINIHASLLPKLRGAAPIQYSILEGHTKTGVCIMRIEEGLDSGPVAIRKELEVKEQNTEELTLALSQLGAEALVEYLKKLKKGQVEFQLQNHEASTYAHKIENHMTWLDFYSESALDLQRKVRAFNPTPGARFKIGQDSFKVYEVKLEGSKNLEPGSYLSDGKNLFIGTAEGSLSVEKIQRAGKKVMDIRPFLAGYKLPESGRINPIEGE